MENFTLTETLRKSAASFKSRRALFVPGKIDISHSQLHDLVENAAAKLIAAGVDSGNVVALTFPNTVEYVIMFLAVIRARATAAPLNAGYTQEEFEFYLSDSESKILFTDTKGNPAAEAAASKIGIPHATAKLKHLKTIDIEISLPNLSDLNNLDILLNDVANDSDDVALFLHTSGTTSRPKGVPLTQQNLAASVRNISFVYRFTESDSTVIVLPLFHVHGLVAGLLSSLSAGAAVTFPAAGRFSASTFCGKKIGPSHRVDDLYQLKYFHLPSFSRVRSDMIVSNATWYTAVPTIHQILLERHATKPEPSYPKLRFIRSCSASLAPAILTRLEETFGAPVLEAYAMTEASHLMASNPLPEDGPHKPGSVGRPVGQEMAVLDEEGKPVDVGMVGEVCIRGENVTKGYKNNVEENRAAFLYGWFHTGDVGFMDKDGYLHLVGRIKELINRGGEKISPIEVDAVLLSHPDVAQAVTFGVPDDKYGEEINCAIILRDGVEFEAEEISNYCKKNLAAFKVPKKIFIIDSLPKTATGKIQRRLVAEHFTTPMKAPKSGA